MPEQAKRWLAFRGDTCEDSDFDTVLVVDDFPAKFSTRIQYLGSLLPLERLGPISLIAKTQAEFEGDFPSSYLDIALDGIILYDREGYMQQKLARIRELIQAAGLSRRRTEYGFCWEWQKPPRGHWRIDWSGVHGVNPFAGEMA